MSRKETIYCGTPMRLPAQAMITEVGLRDGLQAEARIVSTTMKLELIDELIAAGLRHIQVVSFVNPRKMPQMADAEQVIANLPRRPEVVFSGLALNMRGAERACRTGLKAIEISISASESHSRRNCGMTCRQAIEEARQMMQLVRNNQCRVYFSIQCAFGCPAEHDAPLKRVSEILESLFGEAAPDDLAQLKLADTAGRADPISVQTALASIPPTIERAQIALHFHDTQGLGLVNVMTALQCGVTAFDTALGGMGGCPFMEGAAGNIATEEAVNLMQSLNIQTGIDISRIAACTGRLEAFFEKRFPGKMHRLKAVARRTADFLP